MLKSLVLKNRSYRRFYQHITVEKKILRELVDLARLSPSGSNLQPLKFVLSCEPIKNDKIFPHLRWAGYLKEWPGPAEGERPAAYIIILGDTRITSFFGSDQGIAAQTIMLGATEKGLGGCIIASIEQDNLRRSLNINEYFEILLVLALGKPKEKVILEKLKKEGDIKYWRDESGYHHVPKRALNDLIIEF
jgi:nitroreductase